MNKKNSSSKKTSKSKSPENAFDNTKTAVYWDDVHITEQGNEIIAKKMFNLFLPLID